MSVIEAVRWSPDGSAVRIIDQRLLPHQFVERDLRTVDEICEAIATLAVRGAPAIGVCGAMGVVTAIAGEAARTPDDFRRQASRVAARIRTARPTAVNLAWAVDRVVARGAGTRGAPREQLEAMRDEATAIRDEDRAMCRRIGEAALPLLRDGARVLTHCNAGALATAGIGTALAPLYLASERGMALQVYVTETRPLLQGSRLTVWELGRAGIPATLITDSAAGALFGRNGVDLCLVGADRIAANGDVANKIGTYPLAVLAQRHGIPFYVAAPSSTIDPRTPTGAEISIEERPAAEVTSVLGHAVAPADATAWNPAFDVTPAALLSGIISDRAFHRAPYEFH